MLEPRRLGIGLVVSAWTWFIPGVASAQFAPPPATSTTPVLPPAAIMANPYMNPYLNPYTNPLATQQPMNAGNALLYLYGAQQAKGGLGSGRLPGSRPSASTSRSRPAEMPNTASSPGGGAARYFNPGPVNGGGAGRYYNQRGRYFLNNGR